MVNYYKFTSSGLHLPETIVLLLISASAVHVYLLNMRMNKMINKRENYLMDISNLDIRPLFCFCVFVVVVFLFTKQFWAIESGGFMFDYDCLGQLTRILIIHQQINVTFEVN